jgi:aminopeptidase YwaD
LLDDYLAQIAQQDISERRDALCNILTGIGVAFDVQSKERPINIHVPMHRDSLPYILVGAHYNNLVDSIGANNNASAVAVALGLLRVFHFIQTKKQRPLPLEFVFFDGQEAGSAAYAKHADAQQLYAMLNLNLCGVGDTVLMATGKHVANSPVEKAIRRLEDSPHQASLRVVELLPPGNELAFEALGVPTISVCIVPDDDVVPMIGLAVSMHKQPYL